MVAAIDRAIGYLNNNVMSFNGLVIILSGIMHTASYYIKIHCIIHRVT
jgi:hypothetical protein